MTIPTENRNSWNEIERSLGLRANDMLAQSKDPGRRVYRCGSTVYKVVNVELKNSDFKRRNDLSAEYQLLQRLAGTKGIVNPQELIVNDAYQAMRMEFLEGNLLSSISIWNMRWWVVYFKLLPILWTLSTNRIAHNDLKPHNVLIRKDSNKVVLLDFDQAEVVPFFKALYFNFFSVVSRQGVHSGLLGLLRRVIKDQYSKN